MAEKLVLPTHIKNSFEYIQKIKKQIDLVVHIIDSRSTESSQSIDIKKIFGDKKILIIHSKPDMSDERSLPNSFNLKKSDCRRQVLKIIKNSLIESYKEKNIHHFPCSQIAIVGIPNVGKSTLINILKNTRSTKNENSPGTTKQIAKFYIGENIWLYDTPGILLPRLNDSENIKKLFLLNSLPINDEKNLLFLEEAYIYLQHHYPHKLAQISDVQNEKYSDFLNMIAQKYNLKTKNNVWDIYESEQKFLGMIHSGKIGKLKWDKPWIF